MTEELEKLVKAAAKKFADKRAPKNPETQWRKGAEWMYDLLMEGNIMPDTIKSTPIMVIKIPRMPALKITSKSPMSA